MSSHSNSSGRNGDPAYWLIAFGLLFTGIAAPVGILMIVLKVLGGTKKRGRHPYYVQRDGGEAVGARTTGGMAQPQEAQDKPSKGKKRARKTSGTVLAQMAKSGKSLTRTGAILSAIFACVTVINAVDSLWMLPDVVWYLQEIIPLLCITAAGLACLWVGLRKQKQVRRYRSYLAMVGKQKAVSISVLASATGNSARRVRDDLEDMLDDGLFPNGFLDYGGDRLVLSADGLAPEPEKAPAQTVTQPPESQENTILMEIRSVNDAIENERLSAQIDQIGVITAKILDFQNSHPDKSPQLHSFLSYYLPTTLKILRAYGQLEAQEVSGENIAAAMSRIEGMMDKVVEGFEKQLDLLFQGDAMDITADVEVLERMLAKDGLSDQQGLTLGL